MTGAEGDNRSDCSAMFLFCHMAWKMFEISVKTAPFSGISSINTWMEKGLSERCKPMIISKRGLNGNSYRILDEVENYRRIADMSSLICRHFHLSSQGKVGDPIEAISELFHSYIMEVAASRSLSWALPKDSSQWRGDGGNFMEQRNSPMRSRDNESWRQDRILFANRFVGLIKCQY